MSQEHNRRTQACSRSEGHHRRERKAQYAADEEDKQEDPDPVGLIVALAHNAAEKAEIALRNLKHVEFDHNNRQQLIEAIDLSIENWQFVKRKIGQVEAAS
jgi:hypothetical protein